MLMLSGRVYAGRIRMEAAMWLLTARRFESRLPAESMRNASMRSGRVVVAVFFGGLGGIARHLPHAFFNLIQFLHGFA